MGLTKSTSVLSKEKSKRDCFPDNDLKSFKNKLKYLNVEDLKALLLKAIAEERKEHFLVLVENLKVILNTSFPEYNLDYYEQCFLASVGCSVSFYSATLIEVHEDKYRDRLTFSLHQTVQYTDDVAGAHELILEGADIFASIGGSTALEKAVKGCCNMEMVCMLLYYGAYDESPENITPFVYSIMYRTCESIQRVLIEYESDFNLISDNMSTLFYAIRYGSPVTIEIIERGADVNYYNGVHNAISLAMHYKCDPKVFEVLWDRCDYEIWKTSYSKSVLLRLLQDAILCHTPFFWPYLKVLVKNECKLRRDIEHHNRSDFYRSDLLISTFYFTCLDKCIQEETVNSLIIHLLSHGAHIFKKDIDRIYRRYNICTPFLNLLLHMDLHDSDDTYGFMYFKYTPVPHVDTYLLNAAICSEVLFESLEMLRNFYSINHHLQTRILDILDNELVAIRSCKKIFSVSQTFPSLLQLSRDAARQAVCLKYNVENSCKLYTVIKHLYIPKCVQDMLLFDQAVYYFPM